MPEIIITPKELQEHKIEKYSFRTVDSRGLLSADGEVEVTNQAKAFTLKSLDLAAPPKSMMKEEDVSIEEVLPSKEVIPPENIEKFIPPSLDEINEPEISNEEVEKINSQNEELLKRIDDLSSQVIKMEMELERKEEEFVESLEDAKEQAFNEGVEKGSTEAQNAFQSEMAGVVGQLQTSIKKLDENSFMYENGLLSLEKELITVALDIAKEVIAKEIDADGVKVATSLASTLLKEVKDASEITIRVSPADSDSLRENFKDHKKIKIEGDEAVSPGGVIILSDIGNINGDIHTRYEQLKKHSLENE